MLLLLLCVIFVPALSAVILSSLHPFHSSSLLSLQVAAEVSAPLSKTEEIVLLGDDRTSSEVTRLLANMPPAVQALTGVDLSKVGTLVLEEIIFL